MLSSSSTSFREPRKAILSTADLATFQQHASYKLITDFLEKLNDSVKNCRLSQGDDKGSGGQYSDAIQRLVTLLNTLQSWINEYPPVENGKSRFGNPSFRDAYDLVEGLVPTQEAKLEVCGYLCHAFGDRKRIDYGTGHELSFIAMLLCLDKLGCFSAQSNNDDYKHLVLVVFWKYVAVMRALQFTYWLEPAGSHGVWGLDDYHFLPFLFGSAQLHDHKYIRPKSIHDADIIEQFSKDYMYLACIQFINSIKTESLAWHSPMLNDISGVKKWQKVNEGMIKMYKGEVLGKLPIMQHFRFGSLIPFDEGSADQFPSEDMDTLTDGHRHVYAFGQEFPTCCGMRIPSAVAAKASSSGNAGSNPLPFD